MGEEKRTHKGRRFGGEFRGEYRETADEDRRWDACDAVRVKKENGVKGRTV